MIILDAWYGRLGNNIIQLSNIIDIAIAYKHNIKIKVKKLHFFDLSVIEKCFNEYNNNDTQKEKECLLKDLTFPINNDKTRKIGPVISKRVYEYLFSIS